MFKSLLKKIKNINFSDISNISCSHGWTGILVFFITLNIFFVVLNINLYMKIDNNEAFIVDYQDSGESSFKQIDKDKLIKTINEFDKKSEEFESLKSIRVDDIVDPSI